MYYINKSGRIANTIDFINPYICIACGTLFEYDSKRVKKLLSKNISYRLNLVEKSIVELHYKDPFSTWSRLTVENKTSRQSVEDFLNKIK